MLTGIGVVGQSGCSWPVPYTGAMSANRKMDHLGHALAAGHSLEVRCQLSACGNRQVIAIVQLKRLFFYRRWNEDLHHVRYRLRCTRCNARHPYLTIVHDAPTMSVGPTSEAEWKRLAARLRG